MLPRHRANRNHAGDSGVLVAVAIRRALMRAMPAVRRAVAAGLAPVLAMSQFLVPVAISVAGAAAGSAVVAVARAVPAHAASQSVLILSTSVNGGSASAEAKAVPSGDTVTVATPSTWDAMTTAQFKAYSVIVIGDPSTSSACALSPPSDALSTAATWGAAVTGNVAVVGTAPVFAGSAGTSLIKDAIAYALAGSGTGLYVSLNCEYQDSAANTAVPLLAGVDGGGFTTTGQGPDCPNSGTVNTQEAEGAPQFNGLSSSALASWATPACSVEETLNSWPAGFTAVAYQRSVTPLDFTASDGATGQPYVLLGVPVSAATQALAPSTGGEVPAGTTIGGANPAAPGATPATAGDPVSTENGDFTQSAADVSVPSYGPPLGFTRTYDSNLAEQQTQTGTPGPLGYGWTDNWATSLSTGRPVPGDIYTLGGAKTDNGDGGPATAAPMDPGGIFIPSGSSNIYIADSADNRVQEIAGTTGVQWGVSMTAGDVYTIAGSAIGTHGSSGDGASATSALLWDPTCVTVDSSGNLYIADSLNNRIQEVAAASGTQRGQSMTADDIYTVAGQANDELGSSGDGGAATSGYLAIPTGVTTGSGNSNLYIADSDNNRIQEVAASSGTQWGQSMTANDIYTVAGNASGNSGDSGNGGAATSGLLNYPEGVSISSAGDMYVADSDNNRIQEVAASSGTQWGQSMTANHIYTVAGNASGNSGDSGDGSAATSALLDFPSSVQSGNGQQLYIADSNNNRIQEVARSSHTEWGQLMTANDIYTIAGSSSGSLGFSGDGGAATSALLYAPSQVALDGSDNLYIADETNYRVRKVSATTADISTIAGNGGLIATVGDDGPATTAALAPEGIAMDAGGDMYIADGQNNRVQEIAATSHTQWGIAMQAGYVYTVAGSAIGAFGDSGDGGPASSALLYSPSGVAVDAAGDLYIADQFNDRVQEVAATSGTQRGIAMTAGDIYTVAGSSTGVDGTSGDGGAATSALLDMPEDVTLDSAGDIYIADTYNSRIQEVPESSGTKWGQAMTAGDIYTVAGSAAGLGGTSGDGGPGTSSLMYLPSSVAIDASGDLYISDYVNNRIQELAAATGQQWGKPMTAGDIYTVVGSSSGIQGASGDGGPATASLLTEPDGVAVDSSGDLYVSDSANNRVQEIAAADGTQWSQLMTADDIYTVAGNPAGGTGGKGFSGDGGPASAAALSGPTGLVTDLSGNLFVSDSANGRLREITATSTLVFPDSPTAGGVTVNEAGGAQVTFTPKSGGNCSSPYLAAGGYCALPQDVGATLTYNSGTSTYTFSPSPGTTYTYGWNGAFTGESDAAGDTLTMAYGTPAPGSGNCPSSASTCETVTSASGRALVIGSNPNGLITTVTDPLARRWTYAYTGSDLTSVTDPMSRVTSYTYGAGSTGNPLLANDMLTVTSPNAQPGGPDAGDATINVYGAAGQVTSQTDPMGFATTFNYSGLNASTGSGVVRVNDPDGNTNVYYYTLGALTAQSAWTGSTLVSEQDYGPDTTAGGTSGGTLLDTWTANGDAQITTQTYDAAGNTTSTTDPLGHQTTEESTTLDSTSCDATAQAASDCSSSQTGPSPVAPGGVITPPSTAPPQGVVYTLYDTDGNELYSTKGVYQPGASAASYLQTTYSLFKGNSVTLSGTTISCAATPPSNSLPCATINADGVVIQLGYNSTGDLTSSATPDGNGSEIAKTTYGYDGDGEKTSETSPDGNLTGANAGNYTTTTAYDTDGEATTTTEAGGAGATATPRTTTDGYDANGDQTTVKDARGYTTTTGYNADGKPALVTDPDGDAALTCYDGGGNVAQVVPPVGVAASNLTAASCPSSYPAGYTDRLAVDATTYTYNAVGERTAVTAPAPAGQSGPETTTYAYDGDGNLIKTTVPPVSNGGQAVVMTDAYDAAGQLTSQTTGAGTSAASTISYCHDPNGDQTSVVYGDGNVSAVASCETGSPWVVSSSSYPTQAGYQTTSAYDSAGELVSTTAPATSAAPGGATTTATFDPAGNMLTSVDPNGVTTTRTYTPLSLTASVSYSGSSAHSVTYSYDADGSQTGMTDATGTSSYVHDPFGELTSATNGARQITGYGYNADGQLSSITYPLPSTATWATTDAVSYGYDNADELTSVSDFNGHQITIGNTADGLPSSQALGSTGDTTVTSYDPADSPSSITLKNSSSTLQSFAYSDAPSGNILSETDTPSSAQSPAVFSYDAKGRVTSMTPGTGSAKDYSYDASTNLVTLPTGATGTYDKAGEITSSALSGTTTGYSYNADGEQLSATQGSTTISAGTWNGATQLTAYDNGAANMTAAAYDGNGTRASSTITPSGKSAVTQGYVWNTVSHIPQLIMDSVNAYVYGAGNTPAEQINLSTGASTYLVADSLGSVRGTVNSSGTLTGSTNYDAWGNPETAGGLAAATPFGYAGGYTDPDGLIYLLNRYYNPATGQFISVDPAITQTLQPYAYADGNPVSLTDPTGLGWWEYQTLTRPSRLSDDIYYDYSLQMTGDMEKAAEKLGSKLQTAGQFLAVLAAIIADVVHNHPEVVAIVATVSAVLVLAGMTAKKWVKIVAAIWKGNGKHTGMYAYTFEDLFGQYYEWSKARACESNAASCGSPGKRLAGAH